MHRTSIHLTAALPLLLALVALGAPELSAQDDPGIQATIDLGLVSASGNTEVTTFNVGEELVADLGAWGVKQTFGVVYGRTDGEVTASSWRAGLRGDRTIVGRIGVYLLGAFDRNAFAGVSRRFEEGIGIVARVVATDTDRLELEGGGGVTQQRFTSGESDSFLSARAAATYRRTLGSASHLQVGTEFLPNLENADDLRINTITELVAPISQQIATKLTYSMRFDREPAEGFGRTDRIFTAGLQITF